MNDNEYNYYRCRLCEGSGKRYDPTMSNWVGNQGTGWISCPACRGKGYNARLKTSEPHWPDGEQIEIDL